MTEEVRYNNTLVSGRDDETLTYTRYVKDEESGKSAQEILDEKVNKTDEITTGQISDQSVTTPKIKDSAVTTEKIAKSSITEDLIKTGAVTTAAIADKAVTTSRLQDGAVTEQKITNASITTSKIKDGNVTTEKISSGAVTTDKIKDGNVTNAKIADNTMTIGKFDPELRKAVQAATGLPENLVEMIQDVDVNLAKLNDTVYPIILSLSVNPDLSKMQIEVKYSVYSDGKPFTPDTLEVTKQVNDNTAIILANAPTSSGSLATDIQGSREIFKFSVTKQGRTGKSTGVTKYLCYYGSNSTNAISDEILNSLTKASTTGVSFNPRVTTKDNDYIWLVVPSYLTISRVTSAGFDVTLAAPQTITNSLGTFKAYRTLNPLTANTWNLVIS